MSDVAEQLSPAERTAAREIFSGQAQDADGNPIEACHYCGGIHTRVARLPADRQPCPRIKRIERHVDGTVLVVEFWPPGDWETDVVFPRDAFDEDDET